MKSWLDGDLGWSIFAVIIPIGAVAILLMSFLENVCRFDLRTSPAWQAGIFHLTLLLMLSMTFVIASRQPLSQSRGLRRFAIAMAVLIPAVHLAGIWVMSGPPQGFRDERIFVWATVSVAGFTAAWLITAILHAAFLPAKSLWRRRQSGATCGPA